jgi:hypothetical protein
MRVSAPVDESRLDAHVLRLEALTLIKEAVELLKRVPQETAFIVSDSELS